MELGIFAKTFQRPTLEGVLDAVIHAGFHGAQFNFSCAGLPTLPESVDDQLLERIARAFRTRNIRMAAISGTFNMIHPDPVQRSDGFRRLAVLAGVCRGLGTRIITLCSGTRNAEDMWAAHADNEGTGAWRDLVTGLEHILPVAETAGVTLAVEPEQGNVVNCAVRARRLLDELRSPALGIVIDAANLLTAQPLHAHRSILSAALEQVGGRVVLAHAKDLDGQGSARVVGQGVVEWEWYTGVLRQADFSGALVVHGLEEREAAEAGRFLREVLHRHRPEATKGI